MVPRSSEAPDIGSFNFHGDPVVVISNEAGNWAVLSQLSQNLSLDPNGQRQMIERKSWSRGKTCVLHVVLPGQNRAYPQFLIHERIVPMWLANITSSRIGDESKRGKIELAQVELADALYAYISGQTREAQAVMPSHSQALRGWAAALEAREAAEARVKELEPAAQSWQTLAAAEGDYSVADAAKILCRDGGIATGRNRLFATLLELRWTFRQQADGRPRAMQYAVDRGWLSELPQSHVDRETGDPVVDAPQVRVTLKGLHELHKRLGGGGSLAVSA